MIIFYHEMEGTSSGAAILIMNLIRGLVSKGHKVVLINFKKGVMHQQLSDIDESLFSVIDKNKESIKRFAANVSRDDIIITTHFYSIFRLFKKANPKILFYCVGHIQLFEANRFFKKINFLFLTRRLVNLLKSKKGVLFIEQNALKQSIKMLSLDPDGFPMLPIPIMTPDKNLYLGKKKSEGKDAIVFTYVGRAVDTKIFPVKKIINDILSLGPKKKVILQIITDDACVFRAALPSFRSHRFEVLFQENFSPQKLDNFLLTNADIHFSQATSALEGAKLGIPTVLVDFAFSEFPGGYRYKFIHQTDPAYIGTDVNEEKSFTGMTMSEIFETVCNGSQMSELSVKCFEYVRTGHNVSIITSRLEQYITNCRSQLNLIKKYLIRYWF